MAAVVILLAFLTLSLGINPTYINSFVEFLHMVQQGKAYFHDYWNYPDWVCSLSIMYIAGEFSLEFSNDKARLLWEQFALHEREKELFAIAILYLW